MQVTHDVNVITPRWDLVVAAFSVKKRLRLVDFSSWHEPGTALSGEIGDQLSQGFVHADIPPTQSSNHKFAFE